MVAKEGENTTGIVQIGNRQVPFRYISIKLYYKDVNLGDNHLEDNYQINDNNYQIDDDNYQMDNGLDAKLRRNLLRKRGRPRKLDQFMANHETFLQSNEQFIESRKKELLGLIEKGVFQPINKLDILKDAKIFNSRFVDEVKLVDNKPFNKLRLVI